MNQSAIALISALAMNMMLTVPVLAQRVVNVNPRVNAQNVEPIPAIYGQFQDSRRSPLDLDSVRIRVNNEEVTDKSTITPQFFSYRPQRPLPPGSTTVEIEFLGQDGFKRYVTWNFVVGATSGRLAIRSISHNAAQPLRSGDNFLATLTGTPNQQATVLFIYSKTAVRELNAQEVSPGVYVASQTVGNTPLDEGIVVGRLSGWGETIYGVAQTPARFIRSSGPPATDESAAADPITVVEGQSLLRFTSHQEGEQVEGRSGFTVRGQSMPRTAVRVKVSAIPRSLGGILGTVVTGNLLVDQTVRADATGQFEIAVPPALITQRGTRYRVEATSVLNNRRETVTMDLIQQ